MSIATAPFNEQIAGTEPSRKIGLKPWLIGGGLLLVLVGLAFPALMLGTPVVGFDELRQILFEAGGGRVARLVVTELRVPRLLLGLLAGAALALSGVLLQDSLRNPLAGPELLGVSAGASAVVAAVVVFRLPVALGLTPWLALAGGFAGGSVVLLAMQRVRSPARIILVGAAMTALLNAVVITIVSLGQPNDVAVIYLFLLGSLAGRTWNYVQMVLPWLIVGVPLALLCGRALNLLQLGDEIAEGLGLKVLRTRFLIALLSAGLVAAVVAVCGPIGFIALLAPHLTRRLLGTTDARQVLPVAALLGAALLVTADLLARLALAPIEIPVGVWTTLIGGPLLLILLRRQFRS
jgi:iron complex transport system permease protein